MIKNRKILDYRIKRRDMYNIDDDVLITDYYIEVLKSFFFFKRWVTIKDGYSECTEYFSSKEKAEEYFKSLKIYTKESIVTNNK
jgi:hypothetical protein